MEKDRCQAQSQATREVREFIFVAARKLAGDWALPPSPTRWTLDIETLRMVWGDSGRFHGESSSVPVLVEERY